MTDPAEFRKRAQECLDMVPQFRPEQRALLVSIAEAWVQLAEAALTEEPLMDVPLFADGGDKTH